MSMPNRPGRTRWAVALAASGVVSGTLAGAAPAGAAEQNQDIVNCVAWDSQGKNIGDNLFYVDATTPAATEVMPIGGTRITCTDLPSSPDGVRITPGPDTTLSDATGPRPYIDLPAGQTKDTWPRPTHPDDDVVYTVTRTG